MKYVTYSRIRLRWVLSAWLLNSTLVWAELPSLPPADLIAGDLIFVEARSEGLSGAINRSTQQAQTQNFDHVGLVEIADDGVFVLHASLKHGSYRQPLVDFMQEQRRNQQALQVFRLRHLRADAIQQAITAAHQLLGKPYNHSYILQEDSYYCSDFIERAFRSQAVFSHIPMNFNNPETQKIDAFWVELYQKMHLAVPQGLPGTNPNQLAGSPQLRVVGYLLQ